MNRKFIPGQNWGYRRKEGHFDQVDQSLPARIFQHVNLKNRASYEILYEFRLKSPLNQQTHQLEF